MIYLQAALPDTIVVLKASWPSDSEAVEPDLDD
jgi:hypothetical protein